MCASTSAATADAAGAGRAASRRGGVRYNASIPRARGVHIAASPSKYFIIMFPSNASSTVASRCAPKTLARRAAS